jgi:hypothetical protein
MSGQQNKNLSLKGDEMQRAVFFRLQSDKSINE